VVVGSSVLGVSWGPSASLDVGSRIRANPWSSSKFSLNRPRAGEIWEGVVLCGDAFVVCAGDVGGV